jgi:glucoamylase
MESLDNWIVRQQRCALAGMLMSVSPVELVKARPGFGQSIHARRGAIVASPVLASYDPDPDYFFHWYRDSAVVIDTLRLLFAEGAVGAQALAHLADFVDFSGALQALDGQAQEGTGDWRGRVRADFTQFLRSPAELSAVRGAAVAAESRVNPDGTLDISRWTRPQHDGPPLRAFALLRWLREPKARAGMAQELGARIAALVRDDLAFTRSHWNTPSYDIWEEELGLHYYTLRVSAAALEEGANWEASLGQAQAAHQLRVEAARILLVLDGYWLDSAGHYRSRVLADGTRSAKELDIAVILAAIHTASDTSAGPAGSAVPLPHAGGQPPSAAVGAALRAPGAAALAPAQALTHPHAHTPDDPRMQESLARLEDVFAAEYAINHARPAAHGPAMGRYAGDVYYSGGAYYFSTLGAAEFCYRAAPRSTAAAAWLARGDGFLETVRAHTPANGELSEQFDRTSGAQTSARHLAWSYAAFLSCTSARRRAVAPGEPQETPGGQRR